LLLDGRQRVVEVRGLQVAVAVAVAAVGRTGQALLRLEWLLLLLLRVGVAKAECRVLHVVAHQHVRRRTEPERKPGAALLVLLRLVHMLLVLEVVEMAGAGAHQATRGIRRHVVLLLLLVAMMLVELVLLKLVRVLVRLHVMWHQVRRAYARQWRQVEAAGVGRHQRRRRRWSHAEHATAGHRCGLSAVQSQRVARVVAVVPQLVVARETHKPTRGEREG
jgi:hypothetical protein